LAAFKPEAPAAPMTYISNDKVFIKWEQPVTNGWPITGYKIFIREHASTTFTQESIECDGSTLEVIDN